mgnify:CR=1 FL=1
MTITQLAEEYGLSKEPNVDFWHHKQSGQWIITHNAIEKIATSEKIELVDWETLNSERDFCRFKITMKMRNRVVTTIGEADKSNCMSKYLGAMAEKRGIDRAVLKLINAYQYGISSEVEADDFKNPEKGFQKTENHIDKFAVLLEHPCFAGNKKRVKEHWLECDSLSKTELMLRQMQQRTEEYDSQKEKELA